MTTAELVSRLRAFEPQLRARGVRSLGLFGSQARGTPTENSDVDLLAEFTAEVSYFDLMQIEADLAREMKKTVQITAAPVRRQTVRATIERDLVTVF